MGKARRQAIAHDKFFARSRVLADALHEQAQLMQGIAKADEAAAAKEPGAADDVKRLKKALDRAIGKVEGITATLEEQFQAQFDD